MARFGRLRRIEWAFSRDGSQIAYAWFNGKLQRYELRVIRPNAQGASQPRVLFDNPDVSWIAPYDWTPDGKRIAVQLQRRNRSAQIGLLATGDGSFVPSQLTDWRGSTRLFLSPDASLLAYDLLDESGAGTRDVFVMRVDGGARFSVAPHDADETVLGWAPDGRTLLFVSDRSGSKDLWVARIAGGKPDSAAILSSKQSGDYQRQPRPGSLRGADLQHSHQCGNHCPRDDRSRARRRCFRPTHAVRKLSRHCARSGLVERRRARGGC